MNSIMDSGVEIGSSIMELMNWNTGFKTDKERVKDWENAISTLERGMEYKEGRTNMLERQIGELKKHSTEYVKTEQRLIKEDHDMAKLAQSIIGANHRLQSMSYRDQQKVVREFINRNYTTMNRKQRANTIASTSKWVHRLTNPNAHDVQRRKDLIKKGKYRYLNV